MRHYLAYVLIALAIIVFIGILCVIHFWRRRRSKSKVFSNLDISISYILKMT